MKIINIVLVSLLFISSIVGQEVLDLSNNSNENNIIIKGTFLSIDTAGLNLKFSASPRVLINEKDQVVFGIEQKDVSIEVYESFIGKMMKFDSVYSDKKIIFNEFTGKMIEGKINIQNADKDLLLCYIGNKDFIIEMKGFYDTKLAAKYKISFEKAIESLFIDTNRVMSIYEDLPFYLDEKKFPYKKELSFMPQSIALSRDIDGEKRIITIVFSEADEDEITEVKKIYSEDVEINMIDDKEIITRVKNTDDSVMLEGIIINKTKVINFSCISSDTDKKAISEFKEIAKSIFFK